MGSASSVKSTRAVFYNSVNGKSFSFLLTMRKLMCLNSGIKPAFHSLIC